MKKHTAFIVAALLLPFLLFGCQKVVESSTEYTNLNTTIDLSKEVLVCNVAVNDGKQVVYTGSLIVSENGEEKEVYKTEEGYQIYKPLWSPDGKMIAFKCPSNHVFTGWDPNGGNTCDVRIYHTDTGKVETLDRSVLIDNHTADEQFYYCWSDDSSKLLFELGPYIEYWDAVKSEMVYIPDDAQGVGVSFAKDGSGIVYTSYTDDEFRVNTYSFATGETKVNAAIPMEGGWDPNILNSNEIGMTDRIPPPVVYSDTKAICYANRNFYDVDLTSGQVTKLLDNAGYAGKSTTSRYFVYRQLRDWAILYIFDTQSMQVVGSWSQSYQRNPVWNNDDTKLIVWGSNALRIIDPTGNQLSKPIPFVPSTPQFTKNGIWYETSKDIITEQKAIK